MNKGTTTTNNNNQITINNYEIETVDHYIYLGQHISPNNASKGLEITRRITLGWQAFGRASAIFKSKDFPLALKRKVYDQCTTHTEQKLGTLRKSRL